MTRAPLNATLPNLDTDHDADQGRTLKKNGAFSRLENDDKIQRFELDPAGPIVLDGRAELVLYAAAEDLKNDDVITAVALVDCPDDVGVCIVFDSVSIGFTGEVDRFSMLTFDFGDQSRTIDPSRHLELWIIVPNPSAHDMWIAYDTIGYESVLRLDL